MLDRLEARLARGRIDKARPSVRREPPDGTRREGEAAMPQIEHVIVLMMENHSYDNYLGMLAGRGDGLPLDRDGCPTPTNPRLDGSVVRMHRFPGTVQLPGVPTQSWNASHVQYDGGSCQGFVRSVEETAPAGDATVPMTYWTEEDLPFYYWLARTFPLATSWFSSCLGPTFPNRRFLTAGTAHGLIDDLPFSVIDYPESGTIFDLLSAHGVSWLNYHHITRVRIRFRRLSHARGLHALRLLGGALCGLFPSAARAVESKLQATADLYPLGLLRSVNHLRPITQFFTDARQGTLPDFCIVDPDFRRSSEENPQDVRVGEAFAAEVIGAVMAGRKWSTSLLIWLYDEHGGYFDHVAPPAAVPPDDVPGLPPTKRFPWLAPVLHLGPWAKQAALADAGPATYDRLGFRVPAVVVSPYAKPGYVSRTVYDHTSILKLVELKWNLPPLTRRDAAAAAPLDMLDLAGAPAFLVPPSAPAPGMADAS